MATLLLKITDGNSVGMIDMNRIVGAGPTDGSGHEGSKSMIILQSHDRGTIKMYFNMSAAELVKQIEGMPT